MAKIFNPGERVRVYCDVGAGVPPVVLCETSVRNATPKYLTVEAADMKFRQDDLRVVGCKYHARVLRVERVEEPVVAANANYSLQEG